MDDPNTTMEEYIKLEEEKAYRRGWVFNWETATYGKIRVNDDLHDLRFEETEFLAIVIDDAFAPQDALACKSQVSTSVNDEIDFRISFDESDNEDYAIICDKNSFSYKMISVNNLKTDSENDNEKACIPSFPPPKPTNSYVNDLDLFKDFENEFPAIVYNDAQMSKSDYLTKQTLSPQHNNESDLNDETSLSEYDEVGQNVLYFNDIFPFNVIHPDNLKSDEDNDNNEIDIIQSSEGNLNTHRMLLCFIMNLYVSFGIPFDPKRYYKEYDCTLMLRRPRYQGLEYTDADIADFEERLERIYSREIHRVQVVDFQGMPKLMRDGLFARMVMEHRDDAALGLHTGEEMESPGFARYWSESERMIPGKGDLHDYWRGIYTDGDFLGPHLSYTLIRDLMLRLCHRMMAHSIAGRSQAPKKVTMNDLFYLRGLDVGSVNILYLLALYPRRFTARRKNTWRIDIYCPKLPIIDMAELVRLQIYEQLGDTWAWVAMGPERLPDAAVGAPEVAQDAPIVDEGGQADLAPVQAPPPPPAPTRTMPQRMARLEEDVHEIREALTEQREVIESMARDFSKFSTWAITGLARMMDKAGVTYVLYSETHLPYQRLRVRQRTGEASTSAG
ncbi:hypothetical protein Tco_0858581 [Tanacetum coccineum]|uniref:Uncharacterized protein n=1 Tax=Tanacetum coccineum TaxID=301880 RepID=A0ABQ5BBC6_9ASTR